MRLLIRIFLIPRTTTAPVRGLGRCWPLGIATAKSTIVWAAIRRHDFYLTPAGRSSWMKATSASSPAHAHVTGYRYLSWLITIGQFRLCCGDLAVPVGGRVLITQGRGWCGMPESAHQFGQGGAGLSGQHRPAVAEVVKPQVGASCRHAGLVAVAVQCRRGQMLSMLGRKKERLWAWINVID